MRSKIPVIPNSRGGLYGLFAIVAAALMLFVLVTDANNAVAQTPSEVPTPPPAVSDSRLTTNTATTTPQVMPRNIDAGGSNACRLEPDRTATCWGSDDDGQSSPPDDETFVALSVGENHACGLRADGTAVCWGNDDNGQASPPSGETFTSITVGGSHSCGLRADGTAVCWGSNYFGQSSPPTQSRTTASQNVVGSQPLQTSSITFDSISAGDVHTCGIRPDGAAVCWGDTRHGRSAPPSGETFAAASLSAGKDHNCALRDDGTAACWGSDANGQSTPPSSETLTALSAGGSHTCGLRGDGSVACWGSNANGQSTPPTSGVFTSISAGDTHTCGVRNDGQTVCWGNNAAGQAAPPAATPVAVVSPTATGTVTATSTASPTPSATPGSVAEKVNNLERRVGVLDGLIDDLRTLIRELTARIAKLEGSPGIEVPTPVRTPTSVSGDPTATPTRTATPTVAAHCIRQTGLGWLTGTWSGSSGCVSNKTPRNAEAGTRYARYYTFTLDAPSDVTVMVTSDDVANPYTYLLEGIGNHGAVVGEHASRISRRLQPGSYTIEATTYNLRATGNFTLTLDIARVRR